jgi:hypothetical protein
MYTRVIAASVDFGIAEVSGVSRKAAALEISTRKICAKTSLTWVRLAAIDYAVTVSSSPTGLTLAVISVDSILTLTILTRI